MTPAELDLLTACVMQEAGDQPPDGKAAVALVVKNRTALHYDSSGTVMSTILRHAQFSWTEYAWAGGHYALVARDGAQQAARVGRIVAQCKAEPGTWATCRRIAEMVEGGSYRGTLYDRLDDHTVLYYAVSLPEPPPWAASAHFQAQVGSQRFYRV